MSAGPLHPGPVFVRPKSGRQAIPLMRGPIRAMMLALTAVFLGVLVLIVARTLHLPGLF